MKWDVGYLCTAMPGTNVEGKKDISARYESTKG